MRARLGRQAQAELATAKRWYESRLPGLGLQFLTAVQDTRAQIARWPRFAPLWPDVDPQLGVRRAQVPAYPYCLAYVIHPEGIVIIAVVHQRRRPGYWLSRIR